MMLEVVLQLFPERAHPLTLAHDPDQILADETTQVRLAERGFRVINETDPVRLRWEVAQFGTWSEQRPLILVTLQPINQLPYDLWQQGHPVSLALHSFFPTLAYPVVQTLTPGQRWQLSRVRPPAAQLGRQGTMDFILRHLFQVDRAALSQPAGLVAWFNQYHQGHARFAGRALVAPGAGQ
jgi:hypothetical protein